MGLGRRSGRTRPRVLPCAFPHRFLPYSGDSAHLTVGSKLRRDRHLGLLRAHLPEPGTLFWGSATASLWSRRHGRPGSPAVAGASGRRGAARTLSGSSSRSVTSAGSRHESGQGFLELAEFDVPAPPVLLRIVKSARASSGGSGVRKPDSTTRSQVRSPSRFRLNWTSVELPFRGSMPARRAHRK